MRKPKKESKPRLAGQKSSLRSLGNNVMKIEERVKVAKGVTPIISPWKCGPGVEKIIREKGGSENDYDDQWFVESVWFRASSNRRRPFAKSSGFAGKSVNYGGEMPPTQASATLLLHNCRYMDEKQWKGLSVGKAKVYFLRWGYVNRYSDRELGKRLVSVRARCAKICAG